MSNRDISHETGRKHARPGRVARASATARATVFLLVAFLVMANFAPARAFASVLDSVYNNPSVMWTDLQSCVVYGPSNEFDAALAIIERTYAKIQITEPMFVELSNEGTGGRFYELAQALKCAADETPSPTGDFLLYSNVSTGVTLYGSGYVWWQHGITFNDELLSGALEDFETIINGGHLGNVGGAGGFTLSKSVRVSSSSNSSRYYTLNPSNGSTIKYWVYQDDLPTSDTTNNQLAPDSVTFVISDDTLRASVEQKIQQGYDLIIMTRVGRSVSGWFCLIKHGEYQLVNTNGWTSLSCTATTSSGNIYGPYSRNSNLNNISSRVLGVSSPDTFVWTTTDTLNPLQSSGTPWGFTNGYDNLGSSGGGGGGGGGTNNWPEPTEPTPDPPEPPDPIDRPYGGTPDIPEPGDPTVPETPQPGNPTTNIYVHVQEPTNTSPTDYTPWLRAILQAINNLGDKLNQESLEIQRALNTFYTNLVSSLKSISGSFLQDLTSWGRQQMQWLSDDLAYSLAMFGADLTEYLDELAQWVVDNLNFDFPNSEFDDSSIVYWLKRIWSKLGNGNINTRPTDPTEDPDGFLEWIRKAIAEFILGLGSSASDVVSDIGDLLSRLFAKFPFSVPWDILAVLGLLDAPTATPRIVIDVPITIGSWHTTYTFDVNLQPYDSAMATARSVFLILFCSWLLWLTPQVLRDLSPEDFL